MRRLVPVAAIVAIVVCAFVLTRGQVPRSPPRAAVAAHTSRFDAEAAWTLVDRQLRYGQRPAGSPQLRALARELVSLLPRGHFERVPGRGLRNVVGELPGRTPGLVIGAHYDTLATPKGFLGANNGAAGTAIVAQLAHDLGRLRRPAGAHRITFVLFDGEEPADVLPEQVSDFYAAGLRGSRAYVRAHAGDTSAMVLLDYVGNRGLRLPHEGTSTAALWEQIRAAARAAGATATFPNIEQTPITDDHTPFLRAGVPAVDLIDWSYDGHSLSDTAARLSRDSLDAVGETLVEFVREWDARP
jgi:hypothetical protein